jgi:hypothetical protein
VASGQVVIRGNLLGDAELCDMAYVVEKEEKKYVPGDGKTLLRMWQFDHNVRDLSGENRPFLIPLGPWDKKLNKGHLVSFDPLNADFLRPVRSTPLAREGAGQLFPSFPVYVGALPPQGDEPWDWDKTWRARVRKKATTAR